MERYAMTFLGYPADDEHYGGFEELDEVFNSRKVEREFPSDDDAMRWGKQQQGNILDLFAVHLLFKVERISTIHYLSPSYTAMSSKSLNKAQA
jgi:hypothetical protein